MAHSFNSTPATRPATTSRLATWSRLLLLALLLGAFALRLQALTLQNIWWDEARNIDVALRPFTQVATAPELDIHPPVYFWLLHFWLRALGFHALVDPALLAFGARLLSVVAVMLATALLYPLCRRFGSTQAGLYAVAIAGFAPFWLAEGQETRMYTVGFAFLTAAAYFLLRITESWRLETGDWRLETGKQEAEVREQRTASTPKSKIDYVAFICFAALALLTHYNAVFILVAWYGWWGMVALLHPKRWHALRAVIVSGLAMTLLVAPVLPIALRQIPQYANPNLGIPTLSDYLWQNWQAYLGGYAFDAALLNGYANPWLWAMLALLLLGLAILLFQVRMRNDELGIRNDATRHTPHATRYLTLAFLLIWLFGGLALYYIAVLDRGAFNVRYSSFVTPALYLLMGLALAAWGKRFQVMGWLGLAVLGFGFGPLLHADLYDARFAREDIASVTTWLKETAGPNDVIFVDQKYPFGFYYQRYVITADATPTGPETAPARYLFVDINTLDQQLSTWAGQAGKVFWVQWFESDTDPRHGVRFLLDKYGARIDSKDFRGYSVDVWQLTPPTHFVLAPGLTPLTLRFGRAVETVAVSLPTTAETATTQFPVAIRWQRVPNGQADRPLKARVALYDAQEGRLAQSDERVLNDRHLMPSQWQAGDQPLNVYLLALENRLPAGEYTIRLLVYDAETLEPLTFIDEAGNPQGIEPRLVTFHQP